MLDSFNPCFSGFTSTTFVAPGDFDLVLPGFNPCFSGFTSTTPWSSPGGVISREVSILVFWIHFYNSPGSMSCKTGPTCFQSLFFWIHFYNSFPGDCNYQTTRFQSLFFWIHFYNCRTGCRSSPAWTRFQSLFFWIHFYNLVHRRDRAEHWPKVSILVFLDSLLQPSNPALRRLS